MTFKTYATLPEVNCNKINEQNLNYKLMRL